MLKTGYMIEYFYGLDNDIESKSLNNNYLNIIEKKRKKILVKNIEFKNLIVTPTRENMTF